MILKRYRKGIFIVTYFVNKEGKREYLLLKRKLHWKGWEFSKGGVKFLETKNNAVKREIKEESGLNTVEIIKTKIKGKYNYSKILPDRKGFYGQTYQLFIARVNSKKVQTDNYEHVDFLWLSFEKALDKLTWPNQKKCLKFVEKQLRKQ